jgi:hypothetical protein
MRYKFEIKARFIDGYELQDGDGSAMPNRLAWFLKYYVKYSL